MTGRETKLLQNACLYVCTVTHPDTYIIKLVLTTAERRGDRSRHNYHTLAIEGRGDRSCSNKAYIQICIPFLRVAILTTISSIPTPAERNSFPSSMGGGRAEGGFLMFVCNQRNQVILHAISHISRREREGGRERGILLTHLKQSHIGEICTLAFTPAERFDKNTRRVKCLILKMMYH